MGAGQTLLGDRAYDSDALRTWLAEQGAWANVRPMPNRKRALAFSPFLYKYRNWVERRRFLAAADRTTPALRAFCHPLAWSGCRLSEALDVTGADLDPAAGSVVIRSLKKRGLPAVREVPVPD